LGTKLFRLYVKKNSPCHQEKILEVGESDFIFWDLAFLEILIGIETALSSLKMMMCSLSA